MDRRDAFSLLGVREDASPEQIAQAYQYRLKKYKSDDYADEPAYARRKMAELKQAYALATGQAAPALERAERGERRGHGERAERVERRGGGRLKEIGKWIERDHEDRTGSAEHRGREGGGKSKSLRRDIHSTSDCEEHGKKMPGWMKSPSVKLPRKVPKPAAKGDGKGIAFVLTVLALILSAYSTFSGVANSSDYDLDTDSKESILVSDLDRNIYNSAHEFDWIYNPDSVSEDEVEKDVEEITNSKKRLRNAAETFADAYTYETLDFDNWYATLVSNYPDWMNFGEDDELEFRIVNLLEFYEFPRYEDFLGYQNGNGKVMKSLADVLEFFAESRTTGVFYP